MADGYWNSRYNPLQQQIIPHDGFAKRQRTDFEAPPSGLPTIQTHNYLNDIGGPRLSKDAETIGSAYEHFLQNAQNLGRAAADPFQMGQPETRPILGGRAPIDEIGQQMALPPDASSTLYIEGLPSDSKRREVARIRFILDIFRPFVGYKEVRLVSKEAKRSGDTLILCFVDFINPACAATALGALQGYKMDENDRDSPYLRLQFSKNPGPRSRSGPRGSR